MFFGRLKKDSTINWHIPIYCTIFAPMKDRTKIFASLFRKWRKEQNITYYQIKREEGDDIRVDQIARIEKGQEVTTKKLLACVHFCNAHGYDILTDVWNYKETPSNTEKKEVKTDTETELKQPTEIPPTETSNDKEKAPEFYVGNEVVDEVLEDENLEDADFLYAKLAFDNQEPLSEGEQIALIRHKMCPVCGAPLKMKYRRKDGAQFIGCTQWLPENKGCNFSADGTFENPSLHES